jgi:cyclohexa-1,5-dienecarbonyl-CoA hydratase
MEESLEASAQENKEEAPKFIQYSVDDGVARVKLNRPQSNNAMNISMLEEIEQVIEKAEMNLDVKIMVFEGGDTAFSSGLDISDHTEEKAYQLVDSFGVLYRSILQMEAVSVSVVKGLALGSGCELAALCDFSFAAEDSKFGQPEIKAAIFPPVAAAIYPRLIGLRRTFEMLLTGRIYSAREAEHIGLITRAVEKDKLEPEVKRWIEFLKSYSAPALRYARQAISSSLSLPVEDALRNAEEIYLNDLMSTEDAKEGIQAILERRQPVWKDR